MKKTIGIFIMMLMIASSLNVLGFVEDNEKIEASYVYYNEVKGITTTFLDEIDQQQTTNTGSVRIQQLDSGGLGQSFIPTKSTLSKTSIQYSKLSGSPEFAYYYIEIREDIHSSSYLRRIQITGSGLPSGLIWLTIDWIPDISITIGNTYYIVVYASTPTIYTNQIKWCYGTPGDPYPNGNSMINNGPPFYWSAYDIFGDFCFQTYWPGGPSNDPPNTPVKPSGPTSGSVGISYSYATSTTDPDGDDVKYGWDWKGDDLVDDWSGLQTSGTTCSMSYTWTNPGTYELKVKAQDENDALSPWSSALTVVITEDNNPPNKPDTPSGATSGKTGTSYSYSTSTTDPENDQVYYWFDWGDGTNSGWNGPHNSGEIISLSHTWTADGTYPLKVKAKDANDDESTWSDPLSISMPKKKSFNYIPDMLLWLIERFTFLQIYFSNLF